VILHEQHDTGAVFHMREQEQKIWRELEHSEKEQRAGVDAPALVGSAEEFYVVDPVEPPRLRER
jgi:hypothetical protein